MFNKMKNQLTMQETKMNKKKKSKSLPYRRRHQLTKISSQPRSKTLVYSNKTNLNRSRNISVKDLIQIS
jgi:hypothetical protein